MNEGDEINFVGTVQSGSPPYTYVWLRNGVQVFANQGLYKTPPLTFADNGVVYSVVVTNLFSAATQSVTLTVNQDLTPPVISNAVASQDGDSVLVTFSEKVDPTTAGCLANYRIGGLQIYSVDFDELTRRRVSLRTSPQAANTVYTLTVNGVRDASAAGNMIAPNSTRDFSSWGVGAGGGGSVLVEIFTNIPTTLVQALFNDPRYMDNMPDVSYYTNTFSAGVFAAQGGRENYAIRLSGYFTPPSNGLYRFFIRGDDETRIYMNTNGPDPAGRVIIAENFSANSAAGPGGFTSPYQTGNAVGGDSSRIGASVSPILSLTNGTPYYMEAFMKEGGGGDYVTVLMRAIDPNTLTEIGGLPTVAAATDSISTGNGQIIFFNAPVNPDSFIVSSPPPAELFVTENQAVSLNVVATIVPPSLAPYISFQWQQSNSMSGAFVDIPGANSQNYSFFAPLSIDNGAYRFVANVGGRTISYVTLMHVSADVVAPFMVSAHSIDGFTVGILFNEPVAPGAATETGNYYINGDPNNSASSAAIRTNDGRQVMITFPSRLPRQFTLTADFIQDFASNPNVGSSTVPVTTENFVSTDIGSPVAVGSFFSYTNGEIEIQAGGNDIWGASDKGHLTLARVSGDFDIHVRVDSLTPADPAQPSISKAGLMVRETSDPASRTIFYSVNPPPVRGRDLGEVGERTTTGGGTAAFAGSPNYTPVGIPNGWLRAQRRGNIFTFFRGTDGVSLDRIRFRHLDLFQHRPSRIGDDGPHRHGTARSGHHGSYQEPVLSLRRRRFSSSLCLPRRSFRSTRT